MTLCHAPKQPMKRKLLTLLAGLPWLNACGLGNRSYFHTGDPAEDAHRWRFRDIGVELVVTAAEGVGEMRGVKIYSDNGAEIFGSASFQHGGDNRMMMGTPRMPRHVRVVWRKDDKDFKIIKGGMGLDYEGTITGDYTIPVAERIPDAVLEALRNRGGTLKLVNTVRTVEVDNLGGTLRLKFRFHPEGVYLGWEIERRPGYNRQRSLEGLYYPPAYSFIDGDFKEARPAEFYWEGADSYIRMRQSLPTPVSEEDQAYLDRYHLMVRGNGRIMTIPPTPSNYRHVWEKGWYIDKTGQKVWVEY